MPDSGLATKMQPLHCPPAFILVHHIGNVSDMSLFKYASSRGMD